MAHEATHTIQQRGGKRDALTNEHKKSFGNGHTQVILEPGTVLHRLCSQHTRNLLSDYWIDQATFVNLIRKVQTAEALFDHGAGVAGKRNKIRNELALLGGWGNTLTHRQKITLKQEVVAYVGSIKPQSHYVDALEFGRKTELPLSSASARRAKKQVEFRTGGLTQYVIPSFAKKFNERIDENPMVDGMVMRLFRQRPHKTK